jgi:antirestriction protein ArdC
MDISQAITDKIIALLERGTTKTGPRWTGSTAAGLPINARTGEAYHGINVLLLWAEMAVKGYASSRWLTYNQAAGLGGQVRKGEKSVMCVYYQTVEKNGDGQDDDGEKYFMAKAFWLFNLAQIDGLPADLTTSATVEDFNAVEAAEQILIKSKALIDYGFDKAFYASSQDKICLPQRERFATPEIFYATALHELTHWTGHDSRLNRQFGQRFGDDAYAFEELVAELGAAFTVGQLGMVDATIEAHADYVQSWVRVLKSDKRAIFTAASQAAKAADFILAC